MKKGSIFRLYTEMLLRFRWTVLFIILIISAILAVFASQIKTNNAQESWLPEKDRITILFKETGKAFSSNSILFIVLNFSEQGVFHQDSLTEVSRITDLMEGLPELFLVTSLTNTMDIKAIEDGISVDKLLKEIPTDPEELARLKDYVLTKEMYRNTLVSADAQYALIMMNIAEEYDELEVAAKISNLLKKNLEEKSYHFGGDAANAQFATLFQEQDMRRLVPLMLGAMVVILGFGIRKAWGVALSLTTIFLSIIWALGFMEIFGFSMNLLSPPLLVMLIALGSDYAVHLINHYLRKGELRHTGVQVMVPIMMSSFTTMVGLLTFATTKILILKEFGLGLVFGLSAACFLSISFMMVVIWIFRPPSEAPIKNQEEEATPSGPHIFSSMVEEWIKKVIRHPWRVLVVVGLIAVVTGLGIPRITTDVDMVTFLPKDTPPRVSHSILQEHFGGSFPLAIYYRGDIAEPSLLTMQVRAENYLRSNPELSGFTSLAGTLAEMNRLLGGIYTIPETRAGVANLWLLVENESLLNRLVTEERDKALVTAMVKNISTGAMKKMTRFVNQGLTSRTADDILTLDPSRMSSESKARLFDLQIDEAAKQVAWLTAGRIGHGQEAGPFSPSSFAAIIKEKYQDFQTSINMEKPAQAVRSYLQEQTGQGLTADTLNRVTALFQQSFPSRGEPAKATTRQRLKNIIIKYANQDPEEASFLAEGALARYREGLRTERLRVLRQALFSHLPATVKENTVFVHRVNGVLWELLSEEPIFPRSACSSIPGIEKAIIKEVPVQIDQAGIPIVLNKFDQLLYQSQFQSLVLATLAVLILISLTQRSLKKGLVSVITVLLPLEMVLGLMGWFGIPLDFGTVLVGALIIGLGVDGCIHILYYEARIWKQCKTVEQALLRTFRHVGRAILTANITTTGGFFMLIFSASQIGINFGFVNSMAITIVTLAILTLLPALFVIIIKPPAKADTHT